ncbi:MAG TPA: hypothetical protein VGP77_13045 [Vicinamibacterales bacterium]|jgi:Zn-dependent protease|nr:hypothetical protein [Vicinamibacterales bacterium]
MTPISTTLGALVQAEPALQGICTLKLSAKSAYHLTKLARLVAAETAHYHEARTGYIKELGTTLENGSMTIAPDSPNLPEFVKRHEELVAVPVELPWGPITLAMLGDAHVSAADLGALGPLLADPDPDGSTP